MPKEVDTKGELQWTFVPADCLKYLPFKPEALNEWHVRTDISLFCHRLGSDEVDCCATSESEEYFPEHLFELADAMTARSRETYHERGEEKPVSIDYRADKTFGGFAKAWMAWKAIETDLLSEDGYFSLSHTLEATSDIECALELVKRFYYRQAWICLRTFIEDLVYPLYFLHNRSAFDEWKAGVGSLPTMRGKDGILASLVRLNALDADLADHLNRIYKAGNSAVHGASEALIHAGVHSRDWRGLSFKAAELANWLNTAKECFECGIRVVKRMSDDWLAATRNGLSFCRRCHSKDFTVKNYERRPRAAVEIMLGGVKVNLSPPPGPMPELYVFECKACGDVWYGTNPGNGAQP